MPPSSCGGRPRRRPGGRGDLPGGRTLQQMPVEVAVFDVDGTVATCPYDYDGMRAAVGAAARRWGVEADAIGIRGIVERIAEVERQLGGSGGQFREQAEGAVCALELKAAREAVPVPGLREAFRCLRGRGVAVALITRNCRAATDLVLRGLCEYDLVLTRDDVPRVKPDADHVLRSLAPFGGRADRAVVVGDHVYDMEAGRAAGVRFCVGVKTGSSSEERLRQAGADDVLDSAAGLPGWLLAPRERDS